MSGTLNDTMEVIAVKGSYASVIGGAPAAATVFARDLGKRTDADPRVVELEARLDDVHSVERALRVGSIDAIIPADRLRPEVIEAVQRGMRHRLERR